MEEQAALAGHAEAPIDDQRETRSVGGQRNVADLRHLAGEAVDLAVGPEPAEPATGRVVEIEIRIAPDREPRILG